jgi:hypothetical protein
MVANFIVNDKGKPIKNTLLAYIAGFFDAEGCVTITRRNSVIKSSNTVRKLYTMRCTVCQSDNYVLKVIHECFGGGEVQKPKHTVPVWEIGSYKALKFLYLLEPYVIEKKEEVQVAITYQRTIIDGRTDHVASNAQIPFQESQYLLLKKLKGKRLKQMPLMEIHPVEEIYAYLAGFFDGEGFIGIRTIKTKKGKTYHHIVATVTQGYKGYVILELFRYYFGGAIHSNCNRPGHYEWMAVSRQAKVILESLLPYLRIKDEQAKLAIEFQGNIHVKGMQKKLTDEELAVREAQKIMLHNLKSTRMASRGIN